MGCGQLHVCPRVQFLHWELAGDEQASSNGADSGNFGVGVAVEAFKSCRGDVGGQTPSILTFTPRLGIGWFVASHGWVVNYRYGFPLERNRPQCWGSDGLSRATGGSLTTWFFF